MNLRKLLLFAATMCAALPLFAGNNQALQWYVKTTLEIVDPATGAVVRDTRSGVFGQLESSISGWDKYDIPTYTPAQYSQSAIAFTHGESWAERAGDYLSDYRAAGETKAEWAFSVHSTLMPNQVTLNWDGLYELSRPSGSSRAPFIEKKIEDHKLLRKLHLVDLHTAEVIEVYPSGNGKRAVWSYSFNMDGATRRDFRWVLGTVRGYHLDPLSSADIATDTRGNSGKVPPGKNKSGDANNASPRGQSAREKNSEPPALGAVK